MNILRVIYDWPDENNITEGLAPAPYELSLAQAKLGHKIYVLCGNLNKRNIKKMKFKYTLADGKITVYNLPRGLNGFGPFLTTSLFVKPYYLYLKFTKKIDLVHNHGHLGVWFLCYKWMFGFIDKTPVVGHFHATAIGREMAIKKQGTKLDFLTEYFEYPIHRFSDFLMCRVASQIVTVSKDLMEEIKTFYHVPEQKITLLESSVDVERFRKEGEHEKFNFEKDAVILANGGRLSKRKNIDSIVESLKFLPEKYKLILWGPWDEAFKKQVDEIIHVNKLAHRIKYLGVISYFKVDKYYRSADIFLLPSSYEGLPKVIVEALASGCKVIASGFKVEHQMPDLHFVENTSARDLAESIVLAASHDNHYSETRKIIEKNYSWDSKAVILDQVYGKL